MDKITINRIIKAFCISLGYVGLGTVSVLSMYPDSPISGSWAIFAFIATLPTNFISFAIMFGDPTAYGAVLLVQLVVFFIFWYGAYQMIRPRSKNKN